MDFESYAREVNNTARTNFGVFLTSGSKDQVPKEHELLVVACTVAHKELGPQGVSIRPGNFLSKLSIFENTCVAAVKSEVFKYVEEKLCEEDTDPDSPKFSQLFADFKEDEQSIYPWCSALLFACMKNYHDFMEMRKIKEQMQYGHYHPARGGYAQRGARGGARGPRERDQRDYNREDRGDYNRPQENRAAGGGGQ
jgi:hypothetical protein